MKLIDLGYNEKKLRVNLRHWFRFDHLTSQQGIALLSGISPGDAHALSRGDHDLFDLAMEDGGGLRLIDGTNLHPSEMSEDDLQKISRDELQNCDDHFDGDGCAFSSSLILIYVAIYISNKEYWESGKHPEITPPSYFVEWAKAKDIRPKWLTVAQEIGLIPSSDAPLGEERPQITCRAHVSNNLATLNHASSKFWANADQADRTTHPKKNDVVVWLMEHGFSQKLADSGATIIRPEWATTGRIAEE